MAYALDHTWYVRPEGTPERRAAGGVVVRVTGDGPRVALIPSADFGTWGLPKGGIDGGESDIEAAVREIEEEAGFRDLTAVAQIGTCARLSYDRRWWSVATYFLFTTEEVDGVPRDPEHAGRPPAWFALDALPPFAFPEQAALVGDSVAMIRAL